MRFPLKIRSHYKIPKSLWGKTRRRTKALFSILAHLAMYRLEKVLATELKVPCKRLICCMRWVRASKLPFLFEWSLLNTALYIQRRPPWVREREREIRLHLPPTTTTELLKSLWNIGQFGAMSSRRRRLRPKNFFERGLLNREKLAVLCYYCFFTSTSFLNETFLSKNSYRPPPRRHPAPALERAHHVAGNGIWEIRKYVMFNLFHSLYHGNNPQLRLPLFLHRHLTYLPYLLTNQTNQTLLTIIV